VTDQQVTASVNEGSVPPGLLEALARAVVAALSPPAQPLPDGGAEGTADFLTASEFARRLGVSRAARHPRHRHPRGCFPAVRHPRRRRPRPPGHAPRAARPAPRLARPDRVRQPVPGRDQVPAVVAAHRSPPRPGPQAAAQLRPPPHRSAGTAADHHRPSHPPRRASGIRRGGP